MLLRHALAEFLNSREAAGKTKKTIRFYADNIGLYIDFLEHSGLNGTTWAQPQTVEKFLLHERQRGLSDSTIHARYRALRSFCNWLKLREYIAESPLDAIEAPKQQKHVPRRVKLEDHRRIVDAIPVADASWVDHRDRLIIEMLFWTGLRLGEISRLVPADIDIGSRLIRIVRSKGRRSRFVPYTRQITPLLTAYLFCRPPSTDPHLFLGSRLAGFKRRQYDPATDKRTHQARGRLTESGIQQLVRRRCKLAGLPPFSPHAFRHGFAMSMLNDGEIDIGILAKLLGHKSTAVTQAIYADWETASLSRAYDLASTAIATEHGDGGPRRPRGPPPRTVESEKE